MNKLYTACYPIVWFFFSIVHPRRVIGKNNIPDGRCLICANHTHDSDPVFIAMAFGHKNQISGMAKHELRRVPVIGWILEKFGVIFVNREISDIEAIRKSLKFLKNGGKLLVFPEGTREKEDKELPAKKGAAMMAMRTDSPIVPVYIPRERPWFRRQPVVIGEPFYLPFEGKKPTQEDYAKGADEIMERIRTLKDLI